MIPVQSWPAGRAYIMLPLGIHAFFLSHCILVSYLHRKRIKLTVALSFIWKKQVAIVVFSTYAVLKPTSCWVFPGRPSQYNLMESKLAKMSQVFAHCIALSSSESTATTTLDLNIKMEAVGTKAACRHLKTIKLSANEFWPLKMHSTTNLSKTTLKYALNKHGLNRQSSMPHKSAISPPSKLG